jgi:hypothetical protein
MILFIGGASLAAGSSRSGGFLLFIGLFFYVLGWLETVETSRTMRTMFQGR